MSISSKLIFESFKKSSKEPLIEDFESMTDSSLYSQFKALEKDLTVLLEKRGGFAVVLEQHISFTRPKASLIEVMAQLLLRPGLLETVIQKKLDERFWVLIKKELRKAKAEKKAKTALAQAYIETIDKNKEALAKLIKKSWAVIEPLKEAHFHDSALRKLFGKFFQCLGEILKQKSKENKSVLADVKEFYLRSNKVYGFSSRCQELLGSNA